MLMYGNQSTGLTYMMAETSYYRQETIQARQWFQEGKFGELFYTEGEYWHEHLENLMFDRGERTWRYGFPPMHYPTHSTATRYTPSRSSPSHRSSRGVVTSPIATLTPESS